ncbi:transcription antitermination factor NusB [Endomicrobium proavitum]|uniref:Transcription antitermination protein NusB n=1 Tax=Endomicrobium proavitum TaxID=1408281 RepID=A0A0G3WIZ7_9BACT|nr:transcription antitermination factor NusB [Endomicrobium proavitum]AKL97865.1 transcription antitermination protein [Endomicrobium proavitum]
MSSRREARECSLQMLYATDNCAMDCNAVYSCFDEYYPKGEPYKEFALKLFKGVCDKREEIDALINSYAKNWDLKRMAAVDRNIIRLAAYEVIDMPQTPINVIIDEAVEISKKYSTKDSSKFVNGILDKLKAVRNK